MSAQSNVGLVTGIAGSDMPDVTMEILTIKMWAGRLEIIRVAAPLGTAFDQLDIYR